MSKSVFQPQAHRIADPVHDHRYGVTVDMEALTVEEGDDIVIGGYVTNHTSEPLVLGIGNPPLRVGARLHSDNAAGEHGILCESRADTCVSTANPREFGSLCDAAADQRPFSRTISDRSRSCEGVSILGC